MTEEEARARLSASARSTGGPAVPGWAPYVPVPGVPVLDARTVSFQVAEFAVLAEGRRVRLHAERGFTIGGGGGLDPWRDLTVEMLTSAVLGSVLPDEAEDSGEDHPWEELAGLLRAQGVDVVPEDLPALPYSVEFSDRVRARLLGRP